MRVKMPKRIHVNVHSNGDVSIVKYGRNSYTLDEELVRLSPDQAIGLGLMLLKSASGEITY